MHDTPTFIGSTGKVRTPCGTGKLSLGILVANLLQADMCSNSTDPLLMPSLSTNKRD
jgi:hypothetical protein